MRELDAVDREIIAKMQGGFPICERPYEAMAASLNISLSELELLNRLECLLADRVLTRFGPMYQVERMGGAFVLAALAVPEERYEEVTELVNALPQVAHNYRREHRLNMWFVLATERPERITGILSEIKAATGVTVLNLPKLEEYFLELKLSA